MKNIYIIGVGLIGGSFARDLRKHLPEATLYGIDTNEQHINEAQSLGVIDAAAKLQDLEKADLVVLAIPVDIAVKVLPEVLNLLQELSFLDLVQL